MNPTLEFFNHLYGGLDKGYLVVWRKDTKHSSYLPIRALSDLLPDYINHNAGQSDLYFGLGVQPAIPDKGRGYENDVIAIPGVWVDIDCSYGVHSAANLPSGLDEVLGLLSAYPIPSYVIKSGGGYHIYWLFDKPLQFDTPLEAKALVRGYQRGIKDIFKAAGYAVDSTHDLARVLRIPGTYNYKSNPPVPVDIELRTDNRYTFDQLTAYVVAEAAPVSVGKSRGKRQLTIDEAREMLAYIPPRLEYTQWLAVLMALYNEFGAVTGAMLGEEWSAGYEGEIAEKMQSFDGRGYTVTAGTLVYYARANGWVPANYEYPPIPVDITTNDKYVWFDWNKPGVLLVRSQKGTGKTEQLKLLVERALSAGERVLLIGHRIALLQSTARRLGLDIYLDNEKLAASDGLAITLDSLYKLPPNAHYDRIIFDESQQVLEHATGSTLRDTRALCLNLLQSFLEGAKSIVALDADIGRITYNYFERELPGRPITVLDNVYKPRDKTFHIYNKKVSFIHSLLYAANRGQKLFIACNSKQAVQTIGKMLADKVSGYTFMTITSDNSMSDEAQHFLTHINTESARYDALIVSPSVGTGVSIDSLYFDAVYLLGESDITTHLDLLQQAARVRNPLNKEVHVWVSDKAGYAPLNPTYLIESALLSAEYTAKQIGIQLGVQGGEYCPRSADDSRYLALWADVHAIRNSSLNNLRGKLIEALEADEYPIVYVPDINETAQTAVRADYKLASNSVKDEWAALVSSAPDIDYIEYAELKDKHKTDPLDKAKVTKYEICAFYGVPPAAVTPTVVADDSKGLRGKVIALALLTDEIARVYELDSRDYNRGLLIPDRGFYTAARKLRLEGLAAAGIDNLITHADPIDPGPAFITWAVENKARIYSALRIRVRSDIDAKPRILLAALLDQLGLALTARRISTGKGKNRRVKSVYTIDKPLYDAMMILVNGYKSTKELYANQLWIAASGGGLSGALD